MKCNFNSGKMRKKARNCANQAIKRKSNSKLQVVSCKLCEWDTLLHCEASIYCYCAIVRRPTTIGSCQLKRYLHEVDKMLGLKTFRHSVSGHSTTDMDEHLSPVGVVVVTPWRCQRLVSVFPRISQECCVQGGQG